MELSAAAARSRRTLRFALVAGVGILVLTLAVIAVINALLPKPPMAADFILSDQNGKPFTLSSERGHGVVLFFGYTHCPDVCPTTLSALARAKRLLGPSGRDVTVAFVTVDPSRDSRSVVGRYVRLFDPAFVGLTGTDAQLDAVYAAYHVFHQKLPAKSAAGYLVAHSSTIDFIGRDGRIRDTGDWSDTPQQLAVDMKETIS